jgi:acyl-[acyl-carrier-protein]-phospholipid O-acyltransferase / long-chain-fatty-acid--[acyl-carrier-protein] ligase
MKLQQIRGFFPYMLVIFCNSFVDLGHKILIQDTLYQTTSGAKFTILSAIINAFILLPYILLFTPSGFISDKFSKATVIRITAASAIPLTLLITFCYYQGYFWGAFGLTLLLATQSAINSPAKYGYIKELFGKSHLAKANALVQTLAIISILSGTFVFTLLFSHAIGQLGASMAKESALLQSFAPLGFILVAVSVLETAMAFLLPKYQAADPDSNYDYSNYFKGRYAKDYLKRASQKPVIITCIIGLSIFWAINQVLLASYGAYAKEFVANADILFVQGSLAMGGIGILLGAIYAGKISRGFIETGVIPVACIGIAAGLFALPHISNKLAIASLFFTYGIFGGMLIVPLNSLIQFNAGKKELGKILSANNFIQNIFMLGFLLLTVVLTSFGLKSSVLLYGIFACAFFGAIYALITLPQSLTRYVIYCIASRFYKIQVSGLNNLPSKGGVLLLGNHVSFIDWAILQIASPRPIRFVMERSIYEKWYLNWLLKKFKAIPISRGNSEKSLSEVKQGLQEGEVIVIFPEGRLSSNGQIGKFYKGFERAAKDTDAAIVPFYLLGLWGSKTSRAPVIDMENTRTSNRHVSISFGSPMDITSDTLTVRQKVKELSISAWKTHVLFYGSIQQAWLSQAKRAPSTTSIIDSSGQKLSNTKLMATTLYLKRKISARVKHDESVALLLPSSAGGIIANLAVLCLSKPVVNLNYSMGEKLLLNTFKQSKANHIITSYTFIKQLEKKGFDVYACLKHANVIYLEDYLNKNTKLAIVKNCLLVRLLPLFILKKLMLKSARSDDTALILFSSGSEGVPKGIELSHGNILSNIKQVTSVMAIKDSDVMLSSLPLFHAFGLTITTLMPLIQGIPCVTHPDSSNAQVIGKLVYRHQITLLCSTATFLKFYIRSNRLHPLLFSSIRLVIAGAERLSDKTRNEFKQKFNCEVYQGYGATEVSPVASCNLPDSISTIDMHIHQAHKAGSVGLALPGCAFRIVDPNTFEKLPIGEPGMVLIGGSQVMKGYLDDPKKTKQSLIKEGGISWYITGDKGSVDEDGFLTLIDRYSRFIKRGGEMVSLSQVEQQITNLVDGIDDVMAVAITDEQKGENIAMLYSGTEQNDEIKTKLLKSPLAKMMQPKVIIKVESLPKLGSGKKDYLTARQLIDSQLAD